MTAHPIPSAALDDRLGIVGTAGSGKTYGAGTAVERILANGGRAVIPDPLGVWWGLRLKADGKTASGFNAVIFGGAHGDIAINEHAGALIGETVAGMAESAIIDLSGLGTKAAERRFMLKFLTALYRKASGEPVHLIFDEADLWAPQQIRDREQEPAKLLGMMETIVRRGRIKGFIPWLITQRPAVVNKDVLSQADGLVAFKLTASQDRKALGDWIEGQADRAQGKAILGSLPALQRGQAVVWVPGRGILSTDQFPAKTTFDSSRTPKRGEKKQTAELKPIDLGALKERLASVEAETEANDPARLKKRIAELERELRKGGGASPEDIQKACQKAADAAAAQAQAEMAKRISEAGKALAWVQEALQKAITTLDVPKIEARPVTVAQKPRQIMRENIPEKLHRSPVQVMAVGNGSSLPGPQQRVLNAIAWWEAVGIEQPNRIQVAFVAGYKPNTGAFNNTCGALRTSGLVDYPTQGLIVLTEEGRAHAVTPDGPQTTESLHEMIMARLAGPQRRVLQPLLDCWPDSLTAEQTAEAAGYAVNTGAFNNTRGSLRSLGIIDYPSQGQLRAEDILFLGV